MESRPERIQLCKIRLGGVPLDSEVDPVKSALDYLANERISIDGYVLRPYEMSILPSGIDYTFILVPKEAKDVTI